MTTRPMTPQEALVKLSDCGDIYVRESDNWDGGTGLFGWATDSEDPRTGTLAITWEPDSPSQDKQRFDWDLRNIRDPLPDPLRQQMLNLAEEWEKEAELLRAQHLEEGLHPVLAGHDRDANLIRDRARLLRKALGGAA